MKALRSTPSRLFVAFLTVLMIALSVPPASATLSPPDTAITVAPTPYDNSAYFEFIAVPGSLATFECQMDGGGWSVCATPLDATLAPLGPLTEASHTFQVRAVLPGPVADPTPASFTWTYDVTAPGAPNITAGPDVVTPDSTAAFSITKPGGEPTHLKCDLDGAGYELCTTYSVFEGLADGVHNLHVIAVDRAGNESATFDEWVWKVDTAAPGLTVTVDPSVDVSGVLYTADTTPDIWFDADEPATFECRTDGGTWGSCSSPFTPAALAQGAHTIDVRATDGAGNTSTTPVDFTVDTTAPTATITSGPSGTGPANAQFSFVADEDNVTFKCRIDAGAWKSCVSPVDYGPFADGTNHTFDVRATDILGQTGPIDSSTWTVDAVLPSISIDSGPSGNTTSTSAAFTFSSTDLTATFMCKLDTGAFKSCTSPKTYPSVAPGTHEFSVYAVDPAGNMSPVATQAWTVDPSTAPNTAIVKGPEALSCPDCGPWNPAELPIDIHGAPIDINSPDARAWFVGTPDPGVTYQCNLDAGGWTPCGVPDPLVPLSGAKALDMTGLSEGPHTLQVRAVSGSVVDPSPASANFTVDLTPPGVATINTGPAPLAGGTTATFTLTAPLGEPVHLECLLDDETPLTWDPVNEDWLDCTSPYTVDEVDDGVHRMSVVAVDDAGNPSAAEWDGLTTVPVISYWTWEQDATPPVVTIGSRPAELANVATATISFSADEAATFECRLDGASWAACVSPVNLVGLTEGAHLWDVQATDGVGNTSAPTPVAWVVDTVAPNTTILTGPSGTGPANAEFTFESDELGTTFECRLDAGTWEPCTSPVSYGPFLNGTNHTFDVRATDLAGNTDPSPASAAWTVDANAPDVSIDSGPSGNVAADDASFTFSSTDGTATFQCSLDGGTFKPCSSPKNYAALDYGLHTFEVKAIDPAGNESAPASQAWTVTSPVVPDTAIVRGPIAWECPDCTPNPGVPPRALGTDLYGAPTDINSDEASIWFIATPDPRGTFECNLDAGGWLPCGELDTDIIDVVPEVSAFRADLPSLSEGSHTFQVRALLGGQTDPTPASVDFTVDLTPPGAARFISGPPSLTNNELPAFDISTPAGEPVHLECIVDDETPDTWEPGKWKNCESPFSPTQPLDDGTHRVSVIAVDTSGNPSSTEYEGEPTIDHWTFQVDSKPPTVTIDTVFTYTNQSTFDMYFHADEPSTFECKVGAGLFSPCTNPYPFVGLADGTYTFSAQATDVAGNVSTPASLTFIVDTVPPNTTITSPAPGMTSGPASVTFTFTTTEPTPAPPRFQCNLDSAGWTSCSSPRTVGPFAEGTNHTFEVRARDYANNADPTPDSRAWTVDTTPPDVSLDSMPPNPSTDPNATFAFSSTDGTATFLCKMDAGAFAACTSPANFGPLSDGSHTFQVKAVDPAGNESAPASYPWTVDVPTLTVSRTGSGSVTSAPGPIDCPGTCTATYTTGTPVVLTADPASGWAFTGWSGDCSGTGLTCNLTMNGDRSATAAFEEIQANPDAMIKRSRDNAYKGDNVYSGDATGQVVKTKINAGTKTTFDLRFQNDANVADQLLIQGCKSSKQFTVKYTTGGTNVTSKVTSGNEKTVNLQPGEFQNYKLQVTSSASSDGSTFKCTVKARLQSDTSKSDAVQARVIAK